jgi:hypothetical protein
LQPLEIPPNRQRILWKSLEKKRLRFGNVWKMLGAGGLASANRMSLLLDILSSAVNRLDDIAAESTSRWLAERYSA